MSLVGWEGEMGLDTGKKMKMKWFWQELVGSLSKLVALVSLLLMCESVLPLTHLQENGSSAECGFDFMRFRVVAHDMVMGKGQELTHPGVRHHS